MYVSSNLSQSKMRRAFYLSSDWICLVFSTFLSSNFFIARHFIKAQELAIQYFCIIKESSHRNPMHIFLLMHN